MRKIVARLSLLPLVLAATAAVAQADRIVTRMTPDDVLNFLSAQGIDASHPKVKTHRPAVYARLGGQAGVVFLYDCEDVTCGSLKFVVFGKAEPKYDLTFLNAWNSKRRYVGAYLHHGSVYLQMDHDLRGGTTSGALVQALTTFEFLVRDFVAFTP